MKILSYVRKAGLTVLEFALLCGVSRVTVYKWENGFPVHVLRKAKLERLIKAIYYATEARDFPPKNTRESAKEREAEIRTTVIKHLKKDRPSP